MKQTFYERIGESVYREVLPNGLQVCVVPKPEHAKKYAFFATRYGGMDTRFCLDGKWLDTPAGIAHYLEHKMFDTKEGNALQELAANGASPNAFTSNAITGYYFESTEKFEENLRILLGSRPLKDDEGADRVKFAILMLLNEKYGLTEEDFLSAELTMVPAGPAREVGFDRSLIAAYGHDDRVCAYAAFKPLLDLGTPVKTAVCVLADKEEIGSVGISGMQSQYFEMFMEDLCEATGASKRRCFEHSFCLSADVSNAFDPLYAETCDPTNNTKINYGTGIFKYTGARGKSGSSDAAAEVMGYVRRIFAKHDVIWQTGELGKVDQGGGGTVACYMANRNIETVDAGVPVLSMHAPMEIVSKLDTYMTFKGMKVFYEEN